MKHATALVALVFVVAVAGCIGGTPSDDGTPDGDTTPYVTFSHADGLYTVDYPENWRGVPTSGTDLVVQGDTFNGFITSIVVASWQTNETDVTALVTLDAQEVKSISANFRFIETASVAQIGSVQWGKYCYTRFDGRLGIDIDNCNAITLCNGNIIYVSLAASSGRLDSGRTEFDHMLASFTCRA